VAVDIVKLALVAPAANAIVPIAAPFFGSKVAVRWWRRRGAVAAVEPGRSDGVEM
jgi:hypothetical protein